MATIPMGNYGQQLARAPQQINVPRGGADALAGASIQLGNTVQGIAQDQIAQQTLLDDERMRAQSAVALARTTNAMHDAHDEVVRGVLDGSIGTDKAAGELKQRLTKITSDGTEGYMPEQRMVMDSHLTQQAGGLQRSLATAVQKRTQQDIASSIDQFGEQVSREAVRQGPEWAAQKFGAFVDFAGPSAGLNEAQVAKLKQGFVEKAHATFYQLAGTAALTNGDAESLGGLVEKLKGPDGEPLDPQRRATLMHELFGWQQHILAQRARQKNADDDEARRRYNEAVEVFNQATDISMAGGYLSPDFITQMMVKAQGTTMEKPMFDLVASQKTVAGFASLPADVRAATLERARAERATPGVGTDPLNEKIVSAMSTIDEKLRTAAKDNPWEAAQKAGVIRDAMVFNAADPSSAINVVQQRMQMIGMVERWTGAKVSPLQPAEVEQVGKMVRSLPVEQAASLLGQFGQSLGDADRVAALGKQMHDKDGALGMAMMYANAGTTEGRLTAELVLRGDQAVRDKTVNIDKAAETGWRGTIAKQIRGAYSNREVEDKVIDAAFLVAAANYAKDGNADIDRAVRLSTGGIYEQKSGAKVPIPYGMTADQFEAKVKGLAQTDQVAQQAPDGFVLMGGVRMRNSEFMASLSNATLVHAGQGLYSVRAGTSTVTNTEGKRIVLRIAP